MCIWRDPASTLPADFKYIRRRVQEEAVGDDSSKNTAVFRFPGVWV
jgi:hypothetical protein